MATGNGKYREVWSLFRDVRANRHTDIHAHRQTDRNTHTLITILRVPRPRDACEVLPSECLYVVDGRARVTTNEEQVMKGV